MKKSVIAVIATAFAAGAGLGGLASGKDVVPFSARAAGAELDVHLLHVDQAADGGLALLVHSTTRYPRLDGGEFVRGNAFRHCAGGKNTAELVADIESSCAPKGGRLHALELRSGEAVEVYGTVRGFDVGRLPCGLLAEPGTVEALECVDPILDDP